ncbi:T9SS type A sorting domain-containing protein [Bacteroidota bacterium]
MKLKLLLLFIGLSSMLGAQKYDSLVITEARVSEGYNDVYYEITNMGSRPIDLAEINFAMGQGAMGVTDPQLDTVWTPSTERQFYLPPSVAKVLEPGESYVMGIALDFVWTAQRMGIPGYGYSRNMNPGFYQYADFLAHREEKDLVEEAKFPYIKDSNTVGVDSLYYDFQFGNYYVASFGFSRSAQNGFFMTHKWNETDSCVIDQLRNTFGTIDLGYPIAGVDNAAANSILFRKYSIKKGERDFTRRGAGSLGLEDSDWIPIPVPEGRDNWREEWWTIGNHGDYMLDENTLEPKAGTGITVDFSGKTITVPWGTRRLDDIMRKMEKKPGVAWVYEVHGSSEDSLHRSAQTGDALEIYVVGSTLYTDSFAIIVSDPLASDNMVIPIDHMREESGPVTNNAQDGILGWPRVTTHGENDTITGGGYGLPSGLRVDSLFKYLEKAPEATWEIIFVDGNVRADLRNGDKLKVTAKDGSEKEYHLEVQPFEPSYNSLLSSITWPDISLNDIQKFLYGWVGDTIPNFAPSTPSYRLLLPAGHEGIPALVAKTQSPNSTISVKRATSFDGSVADRTTVFTVTSEGGDSVQTDYSVEFYRAMDPANLAPNYELPIISQYNNKNNRNCFVEIVNLGNQPLDLSGYLISSVHGLNPEDAIKQDVTADSWFNRYTKYVPGYKWVDSISWRIDPAMLVEDNNVNSLVQPGDVFLMAELNRDDHVLEEDGYPADGDWPLLDIINVNFANSFSAWQDETDTEEAIQNPWGEDIADGETPISNRWVENQLLFKILNDSVTTGLKAAVDPNDFLLIDWMGDEERWYPAGLKLTQDWGMHRKKEITKGNTIRPSDAPGGSFGTDYESCEWLIRDDDYFRDNNLPGSEYTNLEADLGQHFFDAPTHYISTITAVIYKASPGYSAEETIEGVLNGTTVQQFMGNVYKATPEQKLSVLSGSTGLELGPEVVLSTNDTLMVVAADSSWKDPKITQKTLYKTKYIITTSDQGLSAAAALTSTVYTVTTADTTGTIAGMGYETTIQDIIDNVTVPPGATLTVLDENGMYVPLKRLNNAGEYFDATADYNVYFEVVAENTVTTILYQLQPTVPEGEIFVTSEKYDVSKDDLLIKFIPAGTKYESFLSNVLPSPGAKLKLIDKTGFERTEGYITQDDRLVVTSADETLTVTYFLALMDDELIETTIFLAYITSSVYGVDQVNWKVTVLELATSVTDFLANINPVEGATAVVTDGSGNDKVSGNIANTDMVKVTSANGEITVLYTLDVYTGIQPSHFSNVQLYPNPTNAKIYITGLETGSRIEVYNSLGAKVVDVYSMDQGHTISLEREAAGLYLIIVSLDDVPVGRYKAIKK